MITILAHIFIKEKEGAAMRKAYGTLSSIVGILCNLLLFAGKYAAGIISGSVAIMADAFNNLSDVGSSMITLAGFLFSGKRPDSDHPFGHGRYEYIAGFVVSMAILMMGLELCKTSVRKIIYPEPVENSALVMGILIISILVKLYMVFYNNSIGKKIHSVAMKATAKDSLSDVVSTTVVLVTMLVMHYAGSNIDGFCGVLVSVFILYTGFCAAKETIDPLLGTAPDPEFIRQVEEIVMDHDMVKGLHDLIVHDYGPGRRLISLHAEVPGDYSIYEAHEMIDHIERELNEELGCAVVIHVDPIETDNTELTRIRELVMEKIKVIDARITIHDFRMEKGLDHTQLFFDAVEPYDCRLSPKEFRKKIEQAIEEMEGDYQARVHIDQGYI